MVAGGLGCSTVSEMVAREGLAAGDFVEISIEGSPGVSWMAEVIYPGDDKLTLAGDVFLQNTLKLEGRFLRLDGLIGATVQIETAATGVLVIHGRRRI